MNDPALLEKHRPKNIGIAVWTRAARRTADA